MSCLPITLIALLLTVTAHAQTDSVRTDTQVTQEVDSLRPQPTRRLIKAYQKFIRAQVEEKTLIKVGALPRFGYAGYAGPAYGVSTQVGVEHKLVPALSVLVALQTNYGRLGGLSEELRMRGTVAGRWYYAQNRRMKAGLSANNFSSQYLTIQASQALLSRARLLSTGESYALKADNYLSLGYGIQRRMGRLGYVDWNIGPGYILNSSTDYSSRFTINVSFSIGLGF